MIKKIPELCVSMQAQCKAFLEGRKPAVLFLNRDAPNYLPGYKFIPIDQGDVVYDSEETLDLIKNGDIGLALGYGINHKPGGTLTCTSYDIDGNHVVDIMTDGRKEVEEAALRIAGEGGSIIYRQSGEVVSERCNK
jgi:hypothetical protein